MTTLENIASYQRVRAIPADAMVIDAVRDMCRYHVRALLVGDLTDPIGIVSERDVLERAVLAGHAPATTPVAHVMTAPLVCLPVDCGPAEALEFMRVRHLHQVPVISEEVVVGIVSSTDLLKWARRDTAVELQSLTDYCSLRYPS